ncbi:methyltransferase domain-containing protein [uncultured Helicobacter sp.]|uniref:methyltransferase domain-containing protein n=1 Tax=uncultured Helicobacter sp. TaxID=175537 RepID=UPI00374E9D34
MSLSAQRFLRHAHNYERYAIVQHQMAQKLIEILRGSPLQCTDIFEFGCGTGSYTKLLESLYPHAHFVCNDINDYAQYFDGGKEFLRFDMKDLSEILSPRTFDLITANAAIQWLNQRKCLQTLPRFLRCGGALLLSSFGKRNLWQIRELCGVGLEYLNLEEYEEILSEHFEILHLSQDSHTLRFESAIEAFRHLHFSGVNGVQKGFFLSKELLGNFEKNFANTLTYDCVFIYVRKK